MEGKEGCRAARIEYGEYERLAPAVVDALRALSKAVDDSGLDKGLTELIKVRASQLNDCSFCLNLHHHVALRLGASLAQLELLEGWRAATVFSKRERAALAWTEALTGSSAAYEVTAAYAELETHFSVSEIAFLTAAIAAINAWNRIAGGLLFTPRFP